VRRLVRQFAPDLLFRAHLRADGLVEGTTGPRDLREVQRVNFNPGTEKVVRD
jgi:hypothetical protein